MPKRALGSAVFISSVLFSLALPSAAQVPSVHQQTVIPSFVKDPL